MTHPPLMRHALDVSRKLWHGIMSWDGKMDLVLQGLPGMHEESIRGTCTLHSHRSVSYLAICNFMIHMITASC